MKETQIADERYNRYRTELIQPSSYSEWRHANVTYANAPFALAISSHQSPPSTPQLRGMAASD